MMELLYFLVDCGNLGMIQSVQFCVDDNINDSYDFIITICNKVTDKRHNIILLI